VGGVEVADKVDGSDKGKLTETAVAAVEEALAKWNRDQDSASGAALLFWSSMLAEASPEVYDGQV
jgi:hypothetical protein